MGCTLCFGPNRQGRCELCGAPRRGRKRWCSDACGRVYAINHQWAAARQARLDHDGYLCQRCVSPSPLLHPEVHHVIPVGKLGYRNGCQHHQSNLLTLCPEHHRDEERWGRKVEAILCASGRTVLVEQLDLFNAA